MIQEIKNFLENEDQEQLSLDFEPLSIIQKKLEENGFIFKEDDYGTNGWETDFFWKFSHSTGQKVLLTGSLWNGDITLNKR